MNDHRNGKPGGRIFVPGGVESPQAAGPKYGPSAFLNEARDALRFHDGELALLERLPAQTPDVVTLIAEHKASRARVLVALSRAYAVGAPRMKNEVSKVGQAIEDNFGVAFGARGGVE